MTALLNQSPNILIISLKSFLPSLPAYVQDTTDVLNRLKRLENIGMDTFLATMDVESLYTTIEHKQGLAALRHFLRARPESEMPPNEFLLTLT